MLKTNFLGITWYTVPTHNKHIFVKPKRYAYYGKSAYLGKKCLFWKLIISHLRYSLSGLDSSTRIGLFVYNRKLGPKIA